MESVYKRRSLFAILTSLACLLVAAVVFAFVPRNNAISAEELPSVWDGDLIAAGWGDPADKVKPADYVLDGENKTLSIGSAAAFAYFAHEVYVDSEHALDGVTVKLTVDLDLQNKMWIPIGQTDRSNTPAKRFSGVFDGQGHTISNLSTADYFVNLKYNATDKFYVEYTRASDSKTAKIPFTAKGDEEYSYGLFGVASNITVNNLTVKGIDFNFTEMTYDGAPHKLLPDSMGAIIGYATGNVTIQNCVVGSAQPTDRDSISSTTGNNGSYAGLVGRIYAGINNAGSAPYGDIEFNNCVNYVGFDYNGKSSKIAGILGYAQFFMNCVIKNCVNYGDIDGGQFDGGITSYWSNQITDVNAGTQHFEITNCDNYGNISAVQDIGTNGRDTGGIIGQLRGADSNSSTNVCPIEIKIVGCNNYGNIGSEERAGGIISWYRNTAGIVAEITGNYNFGNVYQYGSATVGGYIGLFEVHRGSVDRAGELTVSGGNIGTVYGTANVGSNFGKKSLTFNDAEHDRLTELFYVDVGTAVVASSVDKIPDASTEHSSYVRTRYDATAAVDDETFKYSGADKKVIIGLADGAETPTKLVIPTTVEKIGYAAFVGQTAISEVVFSANGALVEIESFAFAGTSVVSVVLPKGLVKIDVAAFANCESLNNVILPENAATLDLGEKVFCGTRYVTGTAQGAYLIASNSDAYKLLIADEKYADFADTLTYPVDIEYVYDGNKIATEKKLRGQAYNVVLDTEKNKWDTAELTTVGPTPPDGVTYVWYDSLERDKVVTQVSDVSALLDGVNTDKISLYAFTQTAGGKVFIARNGIVYDKNKSYTLAELNALLYYSSDLITSGMKVVIESYNDSTENLPDVIHDAGKYALKIVDGTDTYELEITVERATMDLASLDALEWNLVSIGDDAARVQLISSTLYIYTYATGDNAGKEYPASQVLTAEQIAKLGLNAEYVTREVHYSVVRNRGKQVTVEITGEGYTVEYEQQSNAKTEVGAYTARATLTADGNYVFTVGNISSLRGMSIEVGSDATTATVAKKWYIVDLGNWLVAQGGGEYAIDGHVYGNGGNALGVTAPALAYTGVGGNITMRLYRNDTLIGSAEGFGTADFAKYINRVMPAGEYRLEVEAEGVTSSEETDSSTPEAPEYADVYHNGFSETLRFTVEKAELPALDAVNTALKGKTFSFEKDSASLYDASAATVVNAYLSAAANLGRGGTVWENYGELYGSFAITYNLARWQSDEYRATVNAASADTYTVYYKVSAPNYYDSIENLANDDSRYGYYFTLVKYEILEIPAVVDDGLVYIGAKVLPEVTESELYEVVWSDSDEYISGGTHSVAFRLYDDVHYRWTGIDGDTATVKFTVERADNTFTVALNMLGWSYETFDAAVNNIRATAKFLDEGQSIKFRVVKKGETTAMTDLDDFTVDDDGKVNGAVAAKLNALKTGDYTLYATVAETGNYKALERNIDFRVNKTMNAWANGDEDLTLPSWIVGKYNEKDDPIVVNAEHGNVNIIITDINGKEYYNSVTGANRLNECEVGKYLLKAWVDETEDYAALAERTFTIEVLEKVGMPWWATLLIVVGALAAAALIIFILWKKGVFQILTEKIVVAIRTRASVDATIASVRAARKAEEGKQSVADAKRRERIEQMRQKAAAQRALPPEEKAKQLEEKANADEERAEKLRARSELKRQKAAKMRGEREPAQNEAPAPDAEKTPAAEAAATETPADNE